MNLGILRPGHKVRMRNGSVAKVLSETRDGTSIEVEYLESEESALPVGTRGLVNEAEVEALLGVAHPRVWEGEVTVVLHHMPESEDSESYFEAVTMSAERVRASLRAVSEQHGYYVFDELMTEEEGKLDFLAVGPPGAVAIVVRDESGTVSAAEDGELLLDSQPFDEDPQMQVETLGNDVLARVSGTRNTLDTLICFSRADVEYPDDLELMRGVCKLWTLSWTLEPEDQEQLSTADVADLADEVERIYKRSPFARPAGTGP